MRDKGLLETPFGILPKDEGTSKLREAVMDYMEKRINKGETIKIPQKNA